MLNTIFDINKFNIFSNDDSYYNLLFLYIMILREESAELIGKIEEII